MTKNEQVEFLRSNLTADLLYDGEDGDTKTKKP